MVQFTPFGQSSLFNNIVAGGGTPLGAVPMNFATATPYQWNTDPIPPEPDTPEDGFDMGVFCSLPANAGHPMCVQNNNGKTFAEERADELYIPTDEEIAGMTNMEYINNLIDRGWLKNSALGYLPSKGGLLTLGKGSLASPYFALAFGKLQKAKRDKMIAELKKRGIKITDSKANGTQINLEDQYAGNFALGQTLEQIAYQERQKANNEKNIDNAYTNTMTSEEIIEDAIKSGGTINPHEVTGSNNNYNTTGVSYYQGNKGYGNVDDYDDDESGI